MKISDLLDITIIIKHGDVQIVLNKQKKIAKNEKSQTLVLESFFRR